MNRKGDSLFHNIIRVLVANFWVALVGFLGSFIFPKILTVDDYAWYHTFTLYMGYIGILHLGFPSGMVVNYAGQDYEKIEKEKYRSEIIILMTILFVFTVAFFLIAVISKNIMVLYVAVSVIPTGIIGSYKALLQTWSRFKFFSRMSTFLASATPIVALIYYFLSGSLPGDVYIIIYLVIHWTITIFIFAEIVIKIKGTKARKFLSKENWDTEKIGIALVAGNYINTLFTSADKQFVNWFFGTMDFAFYSFGMSTQSLMTIFIRSIAQPLFPAMAQGKFKDEQYNSVKNLLFSFGAFSGCAYFVASFIVKMFIQKYIGSLDVIGIYFVVFPAMAVINCLYINLYKIKNKMQMYVKTLVIVLIVAVLLNLLFVKTMESFLGVAIATTITYYVWLFIGLRQFGFLRLDIRDIIFLIAYTTEFFAVKQISNDLIGCAVNFIIVAILVAVVYKKDFLMILRSRGQARCW